MDPGIAIFVVGILISAIILSVCAFYFKLLTLMMVSGGFWLLIGLYSIFNSFVAVALLLGIISLLMSIVMFLAPVYAIPKPEIAPDKTYKELLAERMERAKIKKPDYY